MIRFALPVATHLDLAVYDIRGRLVNQLIDGNRTAGIHEVTWDASDMPSGMYLYRIQTEENSQTKKMILIK